MGDVYSVLASMSGKRVSTSVTAMSESTTNVFSTRWINMEIDVSLPGFYFYRMSNLKSNVTGKIRSSS